MHLARRDDSRAYTLGLREEGGSPCLGDAHHLVDESRRRPALAIGTLDGEAEFRESLQVLFHAVTVNAELLCAVGDTHAVLALRAVLVRAALETVDAPEDSALSVRERKVVHPKGDLCERGVSSRRKRLVSRPCRD